MCVCCCSMCPSVKTFFTWQNILVYSWTDPGRRTAFASPLKKNKSCTCKCREVKKEKREPLISVLFACVELFRKRPLSWNNDAAIHQSVRLPVARASCVTAAKWVYAHDNHTHGQLVKFDNPFTTEESMLIYTTLYSKYMTVCVFLRRSKTTLFSYSNHSFESDLLNELAEPLYNVLFQGLTLSTDYKLTKYINLNVKSLKQRSFFLS